MSPDAIVLRRLGEVRDARGALHEHSLTCVFGLWRSSSRVDRLTKALRAPPPDADAGNFCPRRATQFDAAVSEYCNCDGIELIPRLPT
jgi:hypothetical protein